MTKTKDLHDLVYIKIETLLANLLIQKSKSLLISTLNLSSQNKKLQKKKLKKK